MTTVLAVALEQNWLLQSVRCRPQRKATQPEAVETAPASKNEPCHPELGGSQGSADSRLFRASPESSIVPMGISRLPVEATDRPEDQAQNNAQQDGSS